MNIEVGGIYHTLDRELQELRLRWSLFLLLFSTQRLSAYSHDSGPLHPPDYNSDMSEEWQKLLERSQHEKKGTALVDTCMQEYARL